MSPGEYGPPLAAGGCTAAAAADLLPLLRGRRRCAAGNTAPPCALLPRRLPPLQPTTAPACEAQLARAISALRGRRSCAAGNAGSPPRLPVPRLPRLLPLDATTKGAAVTRGDGPPWPSALAARERPTAAGVVGVLNPPSRRATLLALLGRPPAAPAAAGTSSGAAVRCGMDARRAASSRRAAAAARAAALAGLPEGRGCRGRGEGSALRPAPPPLRCGASSSGAGRRFGSRPGVRADAGGSGATPVG